MYRLCTFETAGIVRVHFVYYGAGSYGHGTEGDRCRDSGAGVQGSTYRSGNRACKKVPAESDLQSLAGSDRDLS